MEKVEATNVTKAEVRADGVGWIRITWDTPVTKDHADFALTAALVGRDRIAHTAGDVPQWRCVNCKGIYPFPTSRDRAIRPGPTTGGLHDQDSDGHTSEEVFGSGHHGGCHHGL